ncbi:MAG: hypothetical protein LQ352_003938 [Teloschistes flavicans]|nr:MAG: hypothetical protein LQ352_003938 [Teloschistes flavicans]
MSKTRKKALFGGGGEGSTSSRVQQPPAVSKADEEVARRLHKEINAGMVGDEQLGDRQQELGYPAEIQRAIDEVQEFAREILSTTCHKCEVPLVQNLDITYWIQKWKATHQMKTAPPATGVTCKCGATTCLGCAMKPRLGDVKFMAEYEGVKLDWCCDKGGVFVAWVVLCEYDNIELSLQANSLKNQAALKQYPKQKAPGGGTGYCSRNEVYNPFYGPFGTNADYRRPFMLQALNFRQADQETDNLTKWILGMLIEILPKRNETNKKISLALPSMIELSLLQDRTAELLRNDSLQDVDKRALLYFAAFEFVGRLAHHDRLDFLVVDQRFTKKQSAGLYAIATAASGKGKGKAQDSLAVVPKGEGMAPSVISCLGKLAIQSRVLLSGSNNQAAGADILEVAKKVDKIYTRLAAETSMNTNIKTWKEYHQAHCLSRKVDVRKHLCRKLADCASQISTSTKGRMSRLVTETSEMTTSLPENIFVRVDEVRPDIMKALIIGPKDTPYEGGLFEFDIVCGAEYPATPPAVLCVTTGQGQMGFNPNLYPSGKVCLSLLGTFPGPPEGRWQPHKSSILQVLVSIQSMILGSEWPLENEPCYEGAHLRGGHALQQCLGYNDRIRKGTMRYAITDWLNRPEMREGLWKDVVKDYIRFCGKDLIQTWRAWEKTQPKGTRPLPVKVGFFESLGVNISQSSAKNYGVDQMESAVDHYRKTKRL